MRILIIIGLGLLAIVAAMAVMGVILGVIGKVVGGTGETILGWLGRKSLQRKAIVPAELAPNSNHLPKRDPENTFLLAYAPVPAIPPTPVAVPCR